MIIIVIVIIVITVIIVIIIIIIIIVIVEPTSRDVQAGAGASIEPFRGSCLEAIC